MTRRLRAVGLVLAATILSFLPAAAATDRGPGDHVVKKKPPAATSAPAPSPPATPTPPPDTQPYDGQLIRLSEILGALSYLGTLCGERNADEWRGRMQALLEAEGTPQARKERFAGAFNRGVQGYGLSYRSCTPNARLVIERFRAEGARIARDIENRYRAS